MSTGEYDSDEKILELEGDHLDHPFLQHHAM
jgi:hypothetical protein